MTFRSSVFPPGRTSRTRSVPHVEPASETVDPIAYTVRLVFAEPDDAVKPGRRVFHVSIQDRQVLKDLDVAAEAGGPRRTLVRTFKGIRAGNTLTVELTPVAGEPILCGVEIVAE